MYSLDIVGRILFEIQVFEVKNILFVVKLACNAKGGELTTHGHLQKAYWNMAFGVAYLQNVHLRVVPVSLYVVESPTPRLIILRN